MNDIKFIEIILPTTMQNIRRFQNDFIQTQCFEFFMLCYTVDII